ncbi:MAG: hypothetical protein M3680_12085 [Myxococcota bacterium]|nr:hypothetical protein [Myxococcota bacterium]
MAVLDAKWQVPDSYDITERALVLPPPRGQLPTAPVLGILSVRALEEQATGEGMVALYAWQVIAGAGAVATQTIEQLAVAPELSGVELLMLGHAYTATGAGEGAAFEIAQRARKLLKVPVTAHSVDASLLLAVTALPYGTQRVRTLLDMLEPELPTGTDEQRAVHALIRAAADPDPARLADAYATFVALDDAFGLAQCALVAHAHEVATTRRPELLRGYLEHAIFRYESDGRPEWAARTISHALVPLLVDELAAPAAEVGELLGRAVTLATEARSQFGLEAVFRIAAKLGYVASVATLSQFDPPTFTRRDPSAATPPPAAVEEPKPKKAAGKKKSKGKSASQ